MNWNERLICRILLMIAKMCAKHDAELGKELQHLSNHITQNAEAQRS